LSVTVPSLPVVSRLLLELLTLGARAGADVVDWVDVVLEVTGCAKAPAVINARAAAAASKVLVMS
jgi:hypothetical protein